MKRAKEKMRARDPWYSCSCAEGVAAEDRLREWTVPSASFCAQFIDFQMQTVGEIQGPCDHVPRWVIDLLHLGKILPT